MSAAAIGAGGGLLGSAITAGTSVALSDRAWRRQKRVLQNQIRWRVADMRAAGINPILAVNPGAGASAPAGIQPNLPDLGAAMSRGAEAAASSRRADASRTQAETDRRRSLADIRQRNAQASAAEAQAAASYAIANRQTEGALTERSQRQYLAAQENYLGAQAQQAQANAAQARALEEVTRESLPAARARAEMWNTPGVRELLQLKEVLQGTPLIRWDPSRQPELRRQHEAAPPVGRKPSSVEVPWRRRGRTK